MKFIKTRLYKYTKIDDIMDPNFSSESEITKVINSRDSLLSNKYGSSNSSDEDYKQNEADAIINPNSSEDGKVTLDLNFTEEVLDNSSNQANEERK